MLFLKAKLYESYKLYFSGVNTLIFTHRFKLELEIFYRVFMVISGEGHILRKCVSSSSQMLHLGVFLCFSDRAQVTARGVDSVFYLNTIQDKKARWMLQHHFIRLLECLKITLDQYFLKIKTFLSGD